jgi:hypothetical protein
VLRPTGYSTLVYPFTKRFRLRKAYGATGIRVNSRLFAVKVFPFADVQRSAWRTIGGRHEYIVSERRPHRQRSVVERASLVRPW